MLNIVGAIVSGLFVGALARFFYPGAVEMGWLWTIGLGIAGSLLAGWATTRGKAGFQRDEAIAATHNLDNEYTFVGVSSVANAVDSFEGGVDGGIEAYREISPGDVVVDRAGHAHDWELELLVQLECAGERPVAADDHQAFASGVA